jgi:hypothetical protein
VRAAALVAEGDVAANVGRVAPLEPAPAACAAALAVAGAGRVGADDDAHVSGGATVDVSGLRAHQCRRGSDKRGAVELLWRWGAPEGPEV